MKKLLISAFGVLALSGSLLAQVGNVGIFTITNTPVLLSTNPISINALQIVPSSAGGVVYLYDNNTASTNYTLASYASVATYTSNIVTTYVGLTGVTNIYTNSVSYTSYTTNSASTNALPISGTFIAPANLGVNATGLRLNFDKGLVVVAGSTNTVQGIYYYKPLF